MAAASAGASAAEPFSIREFAARKRAEDAAKCCPFSGRGEVEAETSLPPQLPPIDPPRRSRWWAHEIAAVRARPGVCVVGGEAAIGLGKVATKRKGSRASGCPERAKKLKKYKTIGLYLSSSTPSHTGQEEHQETSEKASHKLQQRIMGVLGALARHLDSLVGPGIMLLYPLYASMRAIESPSSLDDQQWLTYWVLYSLITLFELSCWKALQWLPLWPYMKLLFCCWLVLPIFNGAAYIYETHVRRYFKIGQYVSPGYTERQRKVLQMMSLDARKSVERFIETHGPGALEKIIQAAEQEAKRA